MLDVEPPLHRPLTRTPPSFDAKMPTFEDFYQYDVTNDPEAAGRRAIFELTVILTCQALVVRYN